MINVEQQYVQRLSGAALYATVGIFTNSEFMNTLTFLARGATRAPI